MPRRAAVALLAIAIAATTLRLLALLGPGGPLVSPTGYDDGVYFSAAGLMLRGVMPHRDFVFVHPPGVLYAYALPAAAISFPAARVMAAVVGGANTALTGAIVMRAAGPFGGIVAAGLYAVYPDAVVAERSPYIEPVLNLFTLAAAWFWLGDTERKRRPLITGLLLAAASATKVWGGIWVVAAAATAPRGRFRSDVPRLVGWSALAGILLLAPVALPAPRAFIRQTLLFHAWRPPDGTIDRAARIVEILASGHLLATVLSVAGIMAMAIGRRSGRDVRSPLLLAMAMGLTVAAFMASSCYWTSYNAHLAASQCALAGFGAAALARLAGPIVTGALIAALAFPSARDVVRASSGRWPEVAEAGRAIRATVPAGERVFAFDPTWTLAARRLPPHGDGAPVVVDSYGAMLLAAVDGGRTFPSADAAFSDPAAQRDVRKRLEASRYAIFGERGMWQMRGETRAWAERTFVCRAPAGDDLCVWQRLDVPPSNEAIAFGEGWYAEEGTPPDTWRWMPARATIVLGGAPAASPAHGPRRHLLSLVLWIPLNELEESPQITLEIDGKPLDRFRPNRSSTVRSYVVDASAGPRRLVITTSRTFNPARIGLSSDSRDLGLSLRRIVWMPEPRDGAASATSSPP